MKDALVRGISCWIRFGIERSFLIVSRMDLSAGLESQELGCQTMTAIDT